MNDWKPISEAPVSHDKYLDDVCRCFVYGPSTGIQMGRAWRYPDGRCRAVTLAFTGDNDITHWMPFPTAPTSHPIPTGATADRDWELACDECNGSGHVFVKHQVAERKTDVQEFKEECEACEGRGFNIAFEDIPGIAEYVKSCRAAPAAGDALALLEKLEAWQSVCDRIVDQYGGVVAGVDFGALGRANRAAIAQQKGEA